MREGCSKKLYRELCSCNPSIPIFSQAWWLDIVVDENNWDVCLVEKGGEVVASMPYVIKNRLNFKLCTMPRLTQTLGPYIKYPKGQKYYKRLSWEKKMMTALIEKNSLDDLYGNFETDIRRRIKKAKNLGVSVHESNDVKKFYELNVKTLNRKNIKISYDCDFLKKLYDTCKSRNAVRMYFAKYQNEVIAANFLVYDDNTVYYIMGGIDPDKKDLGGMDIIQFESIMFAIENGKNFDFEGSMVESIEKYFRSFGAVQKTFFTITKVDSILLRIRAVLLSQKG